MKKFKSYQIFDNFFIYSLTALTCSIFCFSPFWFPYLLASMKAFLFVSLPKVGMVLLSPKVLFFVGNLIIIIILIGESKLFASESSPAGDVCYDEYVSKSTRSVQNSSTEKCLKENVKNTCQDIGEDVVKKKWVDEEEVEVGAENGNNGEDEFDFPAEELSKRADDFIARVNRQRRLEARLLLCIE